MDHHEQHHQHHQKEHEEKKKHQKERGWVVISMKNDWRRIFPFDPEIVPAPGK